MNVSNRTLKNRASHMRKNPTHEEYKLWGYLKTLTPKFHRQYRIPPYIVDFYCPKLKLVVEVDGFQHNEEENVLYDEKRTKFLECKKYKVIRISNGNLKKSELKNTIIYIDAICRERATELNLNIEFTGNE